MTTQLASYRTTAQSTRTRRQANGYYATAAHLAAGRKAINQGVASLTVDELNTLATHPFFSVQQRSYFAELAKQLR